MVMSNLLIQIMSLLNRAGKKTALMLMLGMVLSIPVMTAQDYRDMISSGSFSVEQIKKVADAHFDSIDKGRGSGYHQYKRWEYMAYRLMDENGFLKSEDFYVSEWEKHQAELFQKQWRRNDLNDFWEELGPTYWDATSGWNPGVGRITSFTVDPDDIQHIIVGAQTGGVWRTTDRGKNWTPLCDYFSNMTVYSTAIHPVQKNVYYFGSSQGRIYRSDNAGVTWTLMSVAGASNVNKILIHPENPSLMFVSVQSSGMYRSENAGQNWIRMTNDPASYDIEFKPGDLNTVYASGTAFHYSTDGGRTFMSPEVKMPFQILGNTSVSGGYYVEDNGFTSGRVPIPSAPNGIEAELVLYEDAANYLACVSLSNPQIYSGKMVVVRRGDCNFSQKVLNAQQAGAIAVIVVNNVSGLLNMGGGNQAVRIPAVMIDNQNGERIITALQSMQMLTAKLESSSSDPFSNGPKLIGVSQQNPSLVYVLEASGSIFGGLYKSENAGLTFQKLNHGNLNFFGYSTRGQDDRGQAPRDMGIAVNPSNANEVHIAGILTWRSTNGGVSFECTSDWIPNQAASQNIGYCHADVDVIEFVGDVLYAGTDGGLFYADKTNQVSSNYYTDITKGLGIRQFYKIGVSQNHPVMVSGGSQDNGTSLLTKQGNWIDWLGADGMETFIDASNEQIIYGTSQNGGLYRSFNGGASYGTLTRPGTGSGNWVTPFEQDPNTPNTIYVGYEQVFKSSDRGLSWESISQSFPAKLNHFKVAPSNSNTMYCAYGSNMFRTTQGGGTWQRVTGFSGNINFIAIHPLNEHLVAIATTGVGKVFVSKDGGETWEIYRKNLPDFSALCLTWDKEPGYGLYVGMNYGIFYIQVDQEQWQPFSNNLPNVIINEMEINFTTNKIYAATYGRGLWESSIFKEEMTSTLPVQSYGFKVYPNPVKDKLAISLENTNLFGGKAKLEMFSTDGKLVFHQNDIKSAQFELDVHGIKPGIYFLRIAGINGGHTVRFIKE
jgi:photosystem II stability/assembly factor-like uncharacterized protein